MTSTTVTDTVPATRTTKNDSGAGTTAARTRRPRASHLTRKAKKWDCSIFPRQGQRHGRYPCAGPGSDERRRYALVEEHWRPGSYLLRGPGIPGSAGFFAMVGSRNSIKRRLSGK